MGEKDNEGYSTSLRGDMSGKIKRFALSEAGFDLIGITKPDLPKQYGEYFNLWIGRGFGGEMGYLKTDGQNRARASVLLPGAQSVISVALNYYHPEDPKPADRNKNVGKVAKYAYGEDYHKVMKKKLKLLAKYIEKVGGQKTVAKYFADSGPILEKAFAQESGIGFMGKNTLLITRKFGSYVVLGMVVTNLKLTYDEARQSECAHCQVCMDHCPTQALLGNFQVDARRCISYQTIESKEPMPLELKAKSGEWVFGCDVCQDVCPFNGHPEMTSHRELYPTKIAGTWVELDSNRKIAGRSLLKC